MPTSNSTDWSLNRNQVITGALRKLAVLPSGGTPSTAQISDCSDSLNALIKAMHSDGMPLWKISSQTFTTVDGTASYTVGPSQTVDCPKPLRILQAFQTPSGGTQVPLNVYTRYDFNILPVSSSTEGTPVNLYYQPLRTTGTIKLWPTPSDSTTTITFHYHSPYEDMDASTDDFDFPAEWIMALMYNLAWVMAPEYGTPPTDRSVLAKEAEYWREFAKAGGSEEGGIFFQPNNRF